MLRVFHGAALVAKQLAILQAEAAPRAGRLPKAPVRWERAADEPLKHEWEARQAAGKTGGSSGNGSGKVNEASEGVATSKAAASSVSSSSGTFVDASPIVQSKEQPAAAAPDQAKDGRSWLPLRTDGGGPSAGNATSSHAEPLGAPTASARAQGSTVDVGGPSGAGSSAGTSDSSRPQRSVPSNAITRAVHFGGLGISLAAGAASAAIRRAVAGPSEGEGSSVLATDANVERLAETLCRLRGAALKVGQMLSFNDADVLPPAMRVAMERVRDGADWMPQRRLRHAAGGARRRVEAAAAFVRGGAGGGGLDWTGAPRRLPRRSADRDQGPVPGRGGFDPLRSLVHAAAHLLHGARATRTLSRSRTPARTASRSHPHTPAHGRPARCAVVDRRSSSHGPPSSSPLLP